MFKIKKQKKNKVDPQRLLSIDFLHEEKMKYFEKNKNKKDIEAEIQEYFLNTCDILAKYFESKKDLKQINIEDLSCDRQTFDIEMEYYKACNIDYNIKKTYYRLDNVCCDTEMEKSEESYMICTLCGKVGQKVSDGISYVQSQENPVMNKFIYKRINYFNEWLNQIQGNEKCNLPDTLMESIKTEIKKRNIRDIQKIKPYVIKGILKDLKQPSYYQNINLIISKLTSKPTLTISLENVEKLKYMFSAIQDPYEEIKGNRRNILSYQYILYKLCQLLDLNDCLNHIQLLKSREKMLNHDSIWKKLILNIQEKEGNELWRFIPTC